MRIRFTRGLALALLATTGAAQGAEPVPQHYELRYDARHSLYGDIGTYSNTIDHHGAITTVHSRVHILVKVLGIVMHREDGDRTEHWDGDRLTAYRGVTTANGDRTEISGKAEGDKFLISSPNGTITAPAGVKPSNPWSTGFLSGDTMMRADTGALETVSFSQGHPEAITIAGATVQTQEYDVAANPAYKVWIDARNRPVQFSVDDESGLVTFTLVE